MSSNLVAWPALAGAGVSVLVGTLFAAADTAITSLSSSRLGALIEQSDGKTRTAYERIQTTEAALRSRYLVGRIASTAVTAVCLYTFFEPWPSIAVYLALGVTLIVTATLFEISTTLARKHADSAAAFAARFLRPLEVIMLPIAGPLAWIGATLGRRGADDAHDAKVTEAEVEALVEEGERSGLFGREPAEMIRNVLEFAERTAREVMIPRSKVEAIEIDSPFEKVLQIVAESGHSRYPVYREQLDNVAGLLYAKDLFKILEEKRDPAQSPTLKEIIRSPANFVAESQLLSSLLRDMKVRRQHLAVVVDEFGGVSGIVTLEDVLEEIVGDIRDEHDDTDEPLAFEDLGDGRIVADAAVSMRELCAYLGAEMAPNTDYESLGGMLTHHLGKVPEVGTEVSKFGLQFVVRDSDETRIGKVEIRRPRDPDGAVAR